MPCAAQNPATAEKGAHLFLEKCSLCHSVGGGDLAGPDLIRATQWPAGQVRVAVHRMEDNVGPLTVDEVEALVALLKNPSVKELIAAAESPQVSAKTVEIERGSPQIGRRLFFGNDRFANGGTACFACHAVGGRGGNLAADLTLVRARLGQSALLAVATQPAFPLMKAAYSKRPITEQEAFHLDAFLKESGTTAKAGAQLPEGTDTLHGAAAGVAVFVLAGVGLILRTRRAGVRSRMVRGAIRREGD
ncbi:MAG: c-type cytochrome [Thermoanaerobaculia bacterium]